MSRQSRPLLILTRPAPASQRFAAEVQAQLDLDLEVLIAPLMQPEVMSPPLPTTPPNGVLFTSETGVAALSAQVTWRCEAICVGPQTEAVALQHGWQARMLGGDAERMVAGLTHEPLEGAWLHARGEDAAAPLARILSELGMQVSEAILYRQAALPLSQAAKAALSDTSRPILLPIFSPRSGRIFVAQAREILQAPLWVAAISHAASRAMEPVAPSRVEVAQSPDGVGMLAAVEKLLSSEA